MIDANESEREGYTSTDSGIATSTNSSIATSTDSSIASTGDVYYVSNIDPYIFGREKGMTLEQWFSLSKFVAHSYLQECSGRYDMSHYEPKALTILILDQRSEQISKIQNDLLAYFGCDRLYNISRRQMRRRRRIKRFVVKMLVYLFHSECWAIKGNRAAAIFQISILKPLSHCQRIQKQIDDMFCTNDLSEIIDGIATLNNWQSCDLVDVNFIKTRVRKLSNAIRSSQSLQSILDNLFIPFGNENMRVNYTALFAADNGRSITRDGLKAIRKTLPFIFDIDAFARVVLKQQLSEASKALLL